MRARLVLVAWLAGVAAAIVALSAAGTMLPGPPLSDGDALERWVESDGGATASLAVLRLLGLVLAWYLLGSTVLALAARLAGRMWAISLTDAIAMPMVRRAVESALAVSLTVGAAATSPALAAGVPAAQVSDAEPETATLRLLEPAAPSPAPSPPAAARTYVVEAGDHLWSIAERTVTADLGRPPSEAEVVSYWRALIDRNAGTFAGGDPDLIFPGQTLALPPASPAS